MRGDSTLLRRLIRNLLENAKLHGAPPIEVAVTRRGAEAVLQVSDGGEVIVDGKPVHLERPDDARRAGIATIYQELLLFPELTVAENVFMGHAPRAGLGGLDWRAMRAKTEELLASLEIHDLKADRVVGSLSVGNRQRVEILRAL